MRKILLFALLALSCLFFSACQKKTVNLADVPEPTDKPKYDSQVEADLNYNVSPAK